MAHPAKGGKRYSYSDYLGWTDDQRWEIIDGEAHAMVPAPTTRHQTLQQNLSGLLFNYFRGSPCRPFPAPIDVKLSEHDVVQPDLIVVCDPARIGDKAITGAPDLVIEITSPSTEARDRREKKALYERFGVPEYWIVSANGFIERYVRQDDGRYGAPLIANIGESMTSIRFPELTVQISEAFDGVELERQAAEESRPPDAN